MANSTSGQRLIAESEAFTRQCHTLTPRKRHCVTASIAACLSCGSSDFATRMSVTAPSVVMATSSRTMPHGCLVFVPGYVGRTCLIGTGSRMPGGSGHGMGVAVAVAASTDLGAAGALPGLGAAR
jgi:hypothetical protein